MKELRVKLENQLSASNEKLTSSRSELAYLSAQLDVANKKMTDQNVHSTEAQVSSNHTFIYSPLCYFPQDKFTSILESLKVDHQQVRIHWASNTHD